MRTRRNPGQLAGTKSVPVGAKNIDTTDMKPAQVVMTLAGCAGVAGVLGASFVITTYAMPVPILAGTIVSGGLLVAGLKGTEFEILEDHESLSTALFSKVEKKVKEEKEVAVEATPATEKKDVAVKATTEEKSST